MNLNKVFDHTIGFNKSLFDMLESRPFESVVYPPYNLIELNENTYVVELALAGFNENELSVDKQDNRLIILGTKNKDEDTKFIHKGIAARNFRREFILSDTIVVNEATYEDGVLRVYLKNVVPEDKLARKIPINKSNSKLLLD
jgi:molecular chaperone IbpA